MRVDEIICETPLAVPVAATWVTVVWTAFNVAVAAYDAYDIYAIAKRNNFNADSMTDEDWADVVIDILFLIPGLTVLKRFKGSKPLVKSSIPEPVMQKMVERVKTQAQKR